MSRKLKVLFVCSGNVKGFKVVPFIKEQGDAIEKEGVQIEYFPIVGKGLKGYIKQVKELRKFVKNKNYDVIHAHFILSAWIALLGSRGIPVLISLMGSDAYGEYVGEKKVVFSSRYLTLLTLFIQPFVKAIICKSKNIERFVYLKRKSYIVPNGINIDKFKPITGEAKSLNGISDSKTNILFLGSKSSVRKNISLVLDALKQINDDSLNLVNPYPVEHSLIPHYLNQADVLSLCSFMEGSPNVIKEAMACNCPMVATNVGDVEWVLGKVDGCYISDFDPKTYADNLVKAVQYSKEKNRTEGRKRIMKLGLDSQSIANKVISIYHEIKRKK